MNTEPEIVDEPVSDVHPWDRRILAARSRARATLATHPRLERLAQAATTDTRSGLDRLVPPDRVLLTGIILALLTVTDSVATYVWLNADIAVEANPLVDSLIDWAGAGWALAARALWSLLLIALLTHLARGKVEARFGMVVVSIPLIVVAGLHVLGLILLITT